MSETKLFVLVPDGSKLELTLTSESEDFTATAEARASTAEDAPLVTWKHSQLVNKTVELSPLESPERYVVLVDVVFTGQQQANVEMEAKIVRPDESIHSKPWQTTISGKKPAVDSRVVNILTKK
jgi:hypothetical protein